MIKANRRYWESRKSRFPYHVETGPLTHNHTGDYLKTVQQECGHFLRVPLGDRVMWGFETKDGADKFQEMESR
jgi:hypothetical protein